MRNIWLGGIVAVVTSLTAGTVYLQAVTTKDDNVRKSFSDLRVLPTELANVQAPALKDPEWLVA